MPVVRLNASNMTTWEGFHSECQSVLGLPQFYGRNMDAWVDCLSSLRESGGMTRFALGPQETLELEVLGAASLWEKAPEILETLEECCDAVNERYVESGEKPAVNLVLR